MTSVGVLYVDQVTLDGYADLRLPANWRLHLAGAHTGLSAALRWCFKTHPDEASFGWLADDMLPRTPQWDRLLEQAAGRCYMSQCRDDWVFPEFPGPVREGLEPSAGQCWGGDLVRTVGWWALPGTFQGGTDVAWIRLVHHLGRMRFVDDATVEHRHWRTGKRERDQLDTDMIDYNNHRHTEKDIRILYRWLRSPDFRRTARRVMATCRA